MRLQKVQYRQLLRYDELALRAYQLRRLPTERRGQQPLRGVPSPKKIMVHVALRHVRCSGPLVEVHAWGNERLAAEHCCSRAQSSCKSALCPSVTQRNERVD